LESNWCILNAELQINWRALGDHLLPISQMGSVGVIIHTNYYLFQMFSADAQPDSIVLAPKKKNDSIDQPALGDGDSKKKTQKDA
jgi:hypothetical protein